MLDASVPLLKELILIPLTLLPILFCVGLQITWAGWAALNRMLPT